jgi:hypothetical protein
LWDDLNTSDAEDEGVDGETAEGEDGETDEGEDGETVYDKARKVIIEKQKKPKRVSKATTQPMTNQSDAEKEEDGEVVPKRKTSRCVSKQDDEEEADEEEAEDGEAAAEFAEVFFSYTSFIHKVRLYYKLCSVNIIYLFQELLTITNSDFYLLDAKLDLNVSLISFFADLLCRRYTVKPSRFFIIDELFISALTNDVNANDLNFTKSMTSFAL